MVKQAYRRWGASEAKKERENWMRIWRKTMTSSGLYFLRSLRSVCENWSKSILRKFNIKNISNNDIA